MGDEADALNERGDDGADDFTNEMYQRHYYAQLSHMQKRYADNKRADIGTTIRCACCARRIIKDHRQKQFCSNKGKKNCKDTYWNNVNDNRRYRSHKYK